MRNCEVCNAELPKKNKRFCSQSCKGHYMLSKRDQTGERNPKWNGGKRRTCHGYIQVRVGDTYRYEHVVVMEQLLGRKLEPWEDVHHINGKKDDNSPENLTVMHESEHNRLHGKQLAEGRERDELGRWK